MVLGFKTTSIFFVSAVIAISLSQLSKIGREENEIKDAYTITQFIEKQSSINVCPSQYGNWSKHGYYVRYGQITLVRNEEEKSPYFLANKNDCLPDSGLYQQLPVKLTKHILFKKK